MTSPNQLREESRTGAAKIIPVIMAGGVGTRFWPMSRRLYPKQFLRLIGRESFLGATCRRIANPNFFSGPLVLCNEDHRFIVAEQLREAGIVPQAILLEPLGRGTAAAAAMATLFVACIDPTALLLILTANSHIERPDEFLDTIEAGAAAARAGRLVMFGTIPERPETTYSYIRAGAPLDGLIGAYQVDAILEKPDRAKAEGFVSAGYLWNCRNFLFRAEEMLGEFQRLEPELLAACRRAVDKAKPNCEFLQLDRHALIETPVKSIDHAIMGRTKRAAVVLADIGWSDVDSWDAVWNVSPKNPDGNVLFGDTVLHDVRDSYLRGSGRLIAAIGLDNVVVIETDDVVFVALRSRASEAKGLVEHLKQDGRSEVDAHTTVFRPWGSYRSIDSGDRFQVKRLVVEPGRRLSAQTHLHRAEHWVVVHGTARVTVGSETRLLQENESIYVPLGTMHRLENPGRLPLHLIEVQTGSYLGEDDIIRLDDDYGRN